MPARQSPKKLLKDHDQVLPFLTERTPLLDVRAPVEFLRGHMPCSRNIPILNDAEREQVGIAYKKDGNARATALGHELVSGAIKQQRIEAWCGYLDTHPNASLTCWRGGQRSAIAQDWLRQAGYEVERVPGGFKALRHLCLDVLEQAAHDATNWYVVGGRTGSAKTALITTIDASIDLEGLANHRGSAFGARATPQPAPATFENALASHYFWHEHETLVVEDESRTIGRLALPETWFAQMQQAPLVLIEATLEERAAHIRSDYVDEELAAGRAAAELHEQYATALAKIERRLGGERHKQLLQTLRAAFADEAPHEEWIGALLEQYYDPMYDYQLEKKQARIKYRGSFDEVQAFFQESVQGK